jgi:hypothetical protein
MKRKTQPTRTCGIYSKGSAKGKFRAMSAYIKTTESSQRNYLTLHLKFLEKQE